MFVTISMAVLLIYTAGSIAYVYSYRGNARYETFKEYSRKSWPLFAPLNCLLYLFTSTRGRQPIMNLSDFSELNDIQSNWPVMRKEVENLFRTGYFDQTVKSSSNAYYDIGFRTFYKYGWSKFYLKWYGYTHESGQKLCPETVKVLKKIPMVKGAMFAMLPPKSELTKHSDPIAVSLRYHLGLVTPNSPDCFINVDGKTQAWRDGEAFMFDETYPHFVKNNTDQHRLILMCDIARPTHTFGRVINFLYEGLARLTVVPNLDGDKRGFANRVFSRVSPILGRIGGLKETNRNLYLIIKYSVNTLLLLLILGFLWAVLSFWGQFT